MNVILKSGRQLSFRLVALLLALLISGVFLTMRPGLDTAVQTRLLVHLVAWGSAALLLATVIQRRAQSPDVETAPLFTPQAYFEGQIVIIDGRIVTINDYLANLLGYRPADLVGKPVLDLIDPSYHEVVTQRIASNYLEPYDLIARHSSGQTLWVEVVGRQILFEGKTARVTAVRDITDRKTQEEVLKLFVNHTPAAVAMFDTEVRYVLASKRWLQDYQLEDNIIGKSHYEVFSTIPQRWKEIHAYCLQGHSMQSEEDHFFREDGRTEWLRWEIHPWWIRGEVGGIIMFTEVITERKQLADALQQAREDLEARVAERTQTLHNRELTLRALLDAIPESAALIQANGMVVDGNDTLVSRLGTQTDQMISNNLFDYFPPDAASKLREHVQSVVRSKQRYSYRDEQLGRIMQNHLNPILNEQDEVTQLAYLAFDITDLVQAIHALQESETLFRGAFDHAAVGRAMIAPNGRFRRVNKALCNMLNYTESSLLHLSWQQIIHRDDWQHLNAALAQLADNQTIAIQQETQLIKSDKSIIWAQINVVSIYDAGHTPRYFLADIVNITKRKLAEQAITQYTIDLQRSNQDLEQYAYIASHDLQEPLRMISSYLQLLERRYGNSLDADARVFIGYAVDGAVRMKGLINDLLAYSRVGTRGEPLENVNSGDVLLQVQGDMQFLLEETGATITHDTLPVVQADKRQLAQLLQNLLTNAIKFRSDQPPHIHVSATKINGFWQFGVKDNGIGIEPEYHDKIFVIFRRLHGPDEYPGTGIGLALCKRIVQRHNGRIWVESQPGEGSTFFFTLPTAVASQPDAS